MLNKQRSKTILITLQTDKRSNIKTYELHYKSLKVQTLKHTSQDDMVIHEMLNERAEMICMVIHDMLNERAEMIWLYTRCKTNEPR